MTHADWLLHLHAFRQVVGGPLDHQSWTHVQDGPLTGLVKDWAPTHEDTEDLVTRIRRTHEHPSGGLGGTPEAPGTPEGPGGPHGPGMPPSEGSWVRAETAADETAVRHGWPASHSAAAFPITPAFLRSRE